MTKNPENFTCSTRQPGRGSVGYTMLGTTTVVDHTVRLITGRLSLFALFLNNN